MPTDFKPLNFQNPFKRLFPYMTPGGGSGRSILLVEDDPQIAQAIEYRLSKERYLVYRAADAAAAIEIVANHAIDLVILDIGLPGLDGFSLMSQNPHLIEKIPVLVLTARDSTDDKVRGLRLGADDYLTKPFDFGELIARIDVFFRPVKRANPRGLRTGNLEIFPEEKRLTVGQREVELSPREFDVLTTLVERPNRVISKAIILQRLADEDRRAADLNEAAVEVIVHRLRKKLEDASVSIQTVRGFGYILR